MVIIWYRGKRIGSVDVQFLGKGLYVPIATQNDGFGSKMFKWTFKSPSEIGIDLHFRKDVELIQRLSNYAPL